MIIWYIKFIYLYLHNKTTAISPLYNPESMAVLQYLKQSIGISPIDANDIFNLSLYEMDIHPEKTIVSRNTNAHRRIICSYDINADENETRWNYTLEEAYLALYNQLKD